MNHSDNLPSSTDQTTSKLVGGMLKVTGSAYLGWLAIYADWTAEDSFQQDAAQWFAEHIFRGVTVGTLVGLVRAGLLLLAAGGFAWFGMSLERYWLGRKRAEKYQARIAELEAAAGRVIDERDRVQREAHEYKEELTKAVQERDRLKEKYEPPPPPPPTDAERAVIDRLRVVFRSQGKAASQQAQELLRLISDDLKSTNPLSTLIEETRLEPIKKKTRTLGSWLDRHDVPLEDVRVAFSSFFRVYMRGVRWVHFAAQDSNRSVDLSEPYDRWQSAHQRFRHAIGPELQSAYLESLQEDFAATGWAERFSDDPGGFTPQPNPEHKFRRTPFGPRVIDEARRSDADEADAPGVPNNP